MEPQHPSAPSPATFAQYHHPQPSPHRNSDNGEYAYSEKDAYEQHQYHGRTQRGSKESSKSRAHDSVISHPLSPKTASLPSPASSISSGRRHRSIGEVQHLQDENNRISYPPRAHLDPEKGTASPHRSPSPTHVSTSIPDVPAVVYDSGEYREKGPEDHPVRLLVC
jgi:hypothetical protein